MVSDTTMIEEALRAMYLAGGAIIGIMVAEHVREAARFFQVVIHK